MQIRPICVICVPNNPKFDKKSSDIRIVQIKFGLCNKNTLSLSFQIYKNMALKDILVISGHSGLFKYVSRGRNNVILENLSDYKRTSIPATSKISLLEDIAIFTEDKDLSLREVFLKIQVKENGGAAIHHKSSDAELKKYFEEVLPEYDRDRVYVSDIRKVVQWYNNLLELGITDFENAKENMTEEKKEETS